MQQVLPARGIVQNVFLGVDRIQRNLELMQRPFVDGNKRTGFVVGILFLELNGYRFAASEEEAARMVLELASGNLNDAAYTAFLRSNSSPEKT